MKQPFLIVKPSFGQMPANQPLNKSLLAKIPLVYLINPSLPFHASTDALAGVLIAYTLW